jgi:hypothetical protein
VQVREDTGPERTDEPGPHKQLVADDIRLSRSIPQGLTEKLTNFHGERLKEVSCIPVFRNTFHENT